MTLTLRTRLVATAAAALLAAAAVIATNSTENGHTSADSTWLSTGPSTTVTDADASTDGSIATDGSTTTPDPNAPVTVVALDTTWA